MIATNTSTFTDLGIHADSGRPVLSIADLSIRFPKRYGPVTVLDGVGLEIGAGECVAVVGESGCGKSLLGLAAADLLPRTAKSTGAVAFKGLDLRRLGRRQRRALRGAGIAVVYQDALTSLNPQMSVGAQLRQVCRLGATKTPEELLDSVGLHETERMLRAKPYQISGGQRQRVLIALALAREPELIIADEPTTALDVTVEAQVIALLKQLQSEHRFALMFISHDLALVAQLTRPRHPYTAGLLAASVSLEEGHEKLAPIPGHVAPPQDFASGCRFRHRCGYAGNECATKPALSDDGEEHRIACFHPVPEGGDQLVSADKQEARPEVLRR
jgi:peptide/nickel transport system ATP-binding protein